ncbi:blast:Transposable element P transposase [Drosophila guanche]|uniref:Blast:Transposable element P transposase n=1 Tax=Drosophila guanche TaxID=7266 RepID=A0A3B0JHH4_DROGU|nr:blast:Transposable element P transposase [Drosophila guanche]
MKLNINAIPTLNLDAANGGTKPTAVSTATDDCLLVDQEDVHVQEKLQMKLEIDELQGENKRLSEEVQQLRTTTKTFDKMLTTSQLNKLSSDGDRATWNTEDSAYKACLQTVGLRALQLYKTTAGTLDFVLNLLSYSVGLEDEPKICVLSFDKMRVDSEHKPKSRKGTVPPPENYVQVAMVQGLKTPWKQPIYFDYNISMTAEILNELIRKIYTAGYTVVAVVCDVGPTNYKLWSALRISPEKSWFPHPVDADLNVFVFADVPHLLSDLRFHFLNCGFMWGEKLIGARAIKETLKHFSHSNNPSFWKVQREDLTLSGPERRNAELAKKLLCHTTAVAIKRCLCLKLHVSNGAETAEFVEMVDSWFQLFNSKVPTSSCVLCSVLQQMSAWMTTRIKPGTKAERWPFQEGILISNSSLDVLRVYLADKYGMEDVVTSRLSQDHLEDFFCAMRADSIGDHPTPKEFESRLRKYILDNTSIRILRPCLPELRVVPAHLHNVKSETLGIKQETVKTMYI